MADETTPLTATLLQGPEYVFPGGVSPRSRRHKMHQFQWCMGLTVLLIVLIALLIAVELTDNDGYPTPVLLLTAAKANKTLPTNETTENAEIEATMTPLTDEPESAWALKGIHLNKTQGEQAISSGIKALGDREILEEGLQSTPVNSPAFRHYRSLSTNPEARKLARRGYVENHATLHIASHFNYTKPPGSRNNIGHGPRIKLPDPTLNFTCDFNSRYRHANGVCNNKAHPRHYGASMISYRRMVAPDYADGISQPRASNVMNNGTSSLPPARQVSLDIHRASYTTDSNFTVMLAVFGQFLDHDITATLLTSTQDGESINCCTLLPGDGTVHPECFPVAILPDDPYYQEYNVSCLNFVRSSPAPTGHFGPRQQLNQATSFIDGSMVYGNTEERQRHLRSLSNGTLRMFVTPDGRELLPLSTDLDDGCNRAQKTRDGKYCFEAGDDRANENLLLTSMHLLWARHHNYLARGLQQENPTWDDETVFQEARRILSAQLAHITYNEFLAVLLGRRLAAHKNLLPQSADLDAPDTYDANVNPSIANCFAAAAFRFAHTLLPSLFNMTSDNSSFEAVELHKMLFNPFSLWADRGIDNALNTAVETPVLRVDRFFSHEITQKLFEGTAEDRLPICGLDLVSLNIQRGRDHGLPAYPVFRRHCGLTHVDTWDQMAAAVDAASLDSIKQIYNSPHDVDVYTGALSEPPLEGAIFGPLLTCLVSDQFLRIKTGDSHWYERKIGPQRFTKSQLKEIYKTTLSEIICRNSDAVQQIRKYVMERHKEKLNVYIDCNEIKNFNFTHWRQDQQPPKFHRASVSHAVTLVRILKNKTISPKPNSKSFINSTTLTTTTTTTTTTTPIAG